MPTSISRVGVVERGNRICWVDVEVSSREGEVDEIFDSVSYVIKLYRVVALAASLGGKQPAVWRNSEVE